MPALIHWLAANKSNVDNIGFYNECTSPTNLFLIFVTSVADLSSFQKWYHHATHDLKDEIHQSLISQVTTFSRV